MNAAGPDSPKAALSLSMTEVPLGGGIPLISQYWIGRHVCVNAAEVGADFSHGQLCLRFSIEGGDLPKSDCQAASVRIILQVCRISSNTRCYSNSETG